MAGRNEVSGRDFLEVAKIGRHPHLAAEKDRDLGRCFEAALGIQMRGRGSDPMRRRFLPRQGTGDDITAISIPQALPEGKTVTLVDHPERFTEQKLTGAFAARSVRQVDKRLLHRANRAFDVARRLDQTAQFVRGGVTVGWRYAGIIGRHSDSTLGSASKIARAPMPTPPFGRAGAATGFQP